MNSTQSRLGTMGTDAEVTTPSHQLRQTLMQTPLKDYEVLPLHTYVRHTAHAILPSRM